MNNNNGYLTTSEYLSVIKNAPLVAIDLIIRNGNNKFLLGLRKNEPARGVWFVPGGRIRKGQSIQTAFNEIAHRELGIRAAFEDASFLAVHEHFYETNAGNAEGFGTHCVTLAYEISANDLQLDQLPGDQHDAWKWFAFTELMNSPEVHENTKRFISSS